MNSPAWQAGAFGHTRVREGEERAVILTDACWRRRFGGDPNILGRSIAYPERTLFVFAPFCTSPALLKADCRLITTLQVSEFACGATSNRFIVTRSADYPSRRNREGLSRSSIP